MNEESNDSDWIFLLLIVAIATMALVCLLSFQRDNARTYNVYVDSKLVADRLYTDEANTEVGRHKGHLVVITDKRGQFVDAGIPQ